MGIRDNFAQAVRELTGSNNIKDSKEKRPLDLDMEKLKTATMYDENEIGKFAGFAPPISSFDSGSAGAGKEDTETTAANAKTAESAAEKKTPSFTPEFAKDNPYSFGNGGVAVGGSSAVRESAPPPAEEDDVIDLTSLNTARRVFEYDGESDNKTQVTPGSGDTGYGSLQPNQTGSGYNPGFAQKNMQNPAFGTRKPPQFAGGSSAQSNNGGGNVYGGTVYNYNVSPYAAEGYNYGEENELTVISKNTVIDGNIRSFANMAVNGDIKGDVETTKNMDLNGKVVGNITCNNAEMHAAQIQGNIRMKGNALMERDTILKGDLLSTYAEVNGKIQGNLNIVGKAELKSESVVMGDISASTITVDDGAIIQGYVSTTFLGKEESRNLFPDAIVIGE